MRLVQHPNVVRLYEVIDTPTTLYLVMELAEGGDLYDYILRHEGGVAEGTAKRHFAQIVRAVAYCHQLHVVHRDLKPENVVFFPQQGAVKLTDFGFSNLFQPGTMLATSCGSLAYSAPEILLGEEYDAPAVGKKPNLLSSMSCWNWTGRIRILTWGHHRKAKNTHLFHIKLYLFTQILITQYKRNCYSLVQVDSRQKKPTAL